MFALLVHESHAARLPWLRRRGGERETETEREAEASPGHRMKYMYTHALRYSRTVMLPYPKLKGNHGQSNITLPLRSIQLPIQVCRPAHHRDYTSRVVLKLGHSTESRHNCRVQSLYHEDCQLCLQCTCMYRSH